MLNMRKLTVLRIAWNHEIYSPSFCMFAIENTSLYFVIQEIYISFNMKCDRAFLFSAKNDLGVPLHLNDLVII